MPKTVTYRIPNISCGHCVHTIQTEIAEIKGVTSVIADQARKEATITFDLPANEEQIKSVLSEINYPVVA